jgi:tetratricopeptide (TPR) repeat protein
MAFQPPQKIYPTKQGASLLPPLHPPSAASTVEPSTVYGWINAGCDAVQAKDNHLAIGCFTKALDLEPDNILARLNRGATYYALDCFEEAIADYNKAIEKQPIAKTFIKRGDAKRKQGQVNEALEDYTEAFRIDPHYIQSLSAKQADAFRRKKFALEQHKDLATIESYIQTIACSDTHSDLNIQTRIQCAQARELYGSKLLRHIQIADQAPPIQNYLLAKSMFKKAIEEYQFLIDTSPDILENKIRNPKWILKVRINLAQTQLLKIRHQLTKIALAEKTKQAGDPPMKQDCPQEGMESYTPALPTSTPTIAQG